MSGESKLLEKFLAGIGDRLTEVGELVAGLRTANDVGDSVRKIGRALHTLKGESRLLGLPDITRLCHLGEDVLFSHHRAERISEETELALYEAIDTMYGYVQGLQGNEPLSSEELEAVLIRLQEAMVPFGEDAALPPLPVVQAPEESPVSDEPSVDPARAPGEPTRGVHLTAAQIDQFTNLVGSISGALVRNRQFIDEINQVALEARKLLAVGESAGTATVPEAAAPVQESVRQLTRLLDTLRDFREHHFRLDLSYSELSEGVRDARVQPLKAVFGQYQSFARRLARPLGKRINVELEGEELGVDQRVLAEIAEPCLHLLRNAVHHGIETKEERRRAGKGEDGIITITARQDSDLVHIDFADDGAGIDLERVRRRAQAMGLTTEEEADRLRPEDLARFVFAPGLSTAAEVSEIAGRGVGLDVVENVIASMGGTVKLAWSEPGRGTRFTLIVPVSLSLVRALVIEAAGQLFAVPSAAVVEVFRLSVKEILNVDGREATEYRSKLLPLARLREALGLRGITDLFVNKVGVLVLRAGDDVAGIIVDRFVGEREIVVRPMGEYIGRPFMASGVTIIEDGGVVAVLHVPDLLSSLRRKTGPRMTQAVQQSVGIVEKRILYAEDSVITREYAAGILRASGFEVFEAGDGLEALDIMKREDIDILLTDLQMPRMDGFKLVATLRRDPSLRNLPVVVLTTLDTPETKRMALDAGADAYITKADFAAGTLISTINQVLR